MASTNLDKFREIEIMMQSAEPLMNEFIGVLEERNQFMSIYRSEYRKLRMTSKKAINDVSNILDRYEDDIKTYETVKYNISEVYERLKEVRENEDETEHIKAVVEHLREVQGELRNSSSINIKALEKAYTLSKKYNIPINQLEEFIEYYKEKDDIKIEEVKKLKNELIQVDNEYLSSFKEYREMSVDDDEVYTIYSDIVDDILDCDLNEIADELEEALPEMNEERKARPNAQPLLAILTPIKSTGLEYFQSKNKNSHGYALNVQFAKELAYTRRALLEDREYVGTKNAFDRLRTSFNELSEYMYERYHQLGGTPVNYHGHDNRKKH